MSFLNASWKNLALVNYTIDPSILHKYLPVGTELELWEDKCYISLVGFLFHDTKMLGLRIPFHVDFEEVNLRFYVKRFENGQWKRGVVFIKEIVPKHAIALVANLFFKENYQRAPMAHSFVENETSRVFTYDWFTGKQKNTIAVKTAKKTIPIDVGSEAEFITEHYFGYTKFDHQRTFEYEVTHPRWRQFQVVSYELDIDFKQNYGSDFSFLKELEPTSVLVAEGSRITVENKKLIR